LKSLFDLIIKMADSIVDDLATLPELDEPTLVKQIQIRYNKEKIYVRWDSLQAYNIEVDFISNIKLFWHKATYCRLLIVVEYWQSCPQAVWRPRQSSIIWAPLLANNESSEVCEHLLHVTYLI